MNVSVTPLVEAIRTQVRHLPTVQRLGTVTAVAGLIIESDGPNVGLGELCLLRSPRAEFSVQAEVVGFREHRVLLMPLGDTNGLHVGCEVAAFDRPPLPRPGPEMLGRVLDALGRPFDGRGLLPVEAERLFLRYAAAIRCAASGSRHRLPPVCAPSMPYPARLRPAPRPLRRLRRRQVHAARHDRPRAQADVVVVALVGERGREVREFPREGSRSRGPQALGGRRRQPPTKPAPLRLRAAFTATAIAEAWRDQGKNVLVDHGLGHALCDGPARDRPRGRRAAGDPRLHSLGFRHAAPPDGALRRRRARASSPRSTPCWSRATTMNEPVAGRRPRYSSTATWSFSRSPGALQPLSRDRCPRERQPPDPGYLRPGRDRPGGPGPRAPGAVPQERGPHFHRRLPEGRQTPRSNRAIALHEPLAENLPASP